MTKKEALAIMKELDLYLDVKEWDAIEIAIEALKGEIERESTGE